MLDAKEIVAKFSADEVLDLMYLAGFKRPNLFKPDNKNRVTIRCSQHDDAENKKMGKRASCVLNLNTFNYHCKSCQHKGNLFDIAKILSGSDDFKVALQYLADLKGITDIGSSTTPKPLKTYPKPITHKVEEIKYYTFDPKHTYKAWTIDELTEQYASFNDLMKFKAIMTVLIKHSLKTNESKKIDYLCNERKINPLNHRLARVGFLPKASDDKEFWSLFEKIFPILDLVRFGLYRSSEEKYFPLTWKYKDSELIVFPNQDLYSNLYHGAQLRPTVKPAWSNAKEMQLTQVSLINPIPFVFSREVLMSNDSIVITEGSIDGLSTDIDFAANPGVNTYYKPYLGLFRGKKVLTAYDMDDAGQKATYGYQVINYYHKSKTKSVNHVFLNVKEDNRKADIFKRRLKYFAKITPMVTVHKGLLQDLKDAGVNALVLYWDKSLGNDMNELIQKHGKLKKEFFIAKHLGD